MPAATEAVAWSSGLAAPRVPVPAGATDCHFHVYDSRYPAAPGTALQHPNARPEEYRALQRRLGTARGVLVQPSTYGTDNRLHLAALQALGAECFRMVAVVAPDAPDTELERLHEAGVRGVRFNLTQPGPLALDNLEPMAQRIAGFGWHCQLNMPPDQVVEAGPLLQRLPCRIVFDHLGRIRDPEGRDAEAFVTIRRLLDHGRAWMKLSGIYITSREGPPGYADAGAVAVAFATATPERILWGSDWPHPTKPADRKPDDARLLDLLAEWLPNEDARRCVLVDNPTEVYGFSPNQMMAPLPQERGHGGSASPLRRRSG
jgi:predicted TIM-barrel fold metal-dependent hydrolase